MSKLAHLKRKAAELEQRRLFDKALAVYEEILQEQGGGEETDIALLNRVGDLYLRQGAMEPALGLYEQAADLYAERGFLNNAIALCNKILRQDPRRAEIHLRLGRVSARNGFRADARRHFLEFATQRDRLGAMDDALKSLSQIADEGPEFEDVRLLLADLLVGKGQLQPAVEQLRLAHDYLEVEGRHGEARSVLNRILELDPEYRAAAQTDGAQADAAGHGDATPAPRSSASHRAPDSGLVLFNPTDFVTAATGRDDNGVADDQRLDVLDPLSPDAPMDIAEALSVDINVSLDPEPRTAAERLVASLDDDGRDAGAPDGLLHGAELGLPEIVPVRQRNLTPLDLVPMVEDAEVWEETASPPMEGFLPTADEQSGEAAGDEGAADDGLIFLTTDLPADAGDALHVESIFDAPEGDGTDDDAPDGHATTAERSSILLDLGAISDAELPAGPAMDGALEFVIPGSDFEEPDDAGAGTLEAAIVFDDSAAEPAEAGSLGAAMIDLGAFDQTPDVADDTSTPQDAEDGYPTSVVGSIAWVADPAEEEEESVAAAGSSAEVEASSGEAAADVVSITGGEPPVEDEAVEVAGVSAEATGSEAPVLEAPVLEVPVEAPVVASAPQATSDEDGSYVNLGDWLRDDDGPRSTRMVTEERAPSGDEQADFADMLRKFKQGVAENVSEDDHASYYDLGIAYREMGLVDEAIAALQKALRGTRERVRAFEALGQCFLDRGQPAVAVSVLKRALAEPGLDDERLVGVLYLLGRACEEQSQRTEALAYYQRVFAVDIEFGDVADRIGFAGQVPS